MNELKLGDVAITRVEEMYGPIMPADQFFPTCPRRRGRRIARHSYQTTSATRATWFTSRCRRGCCAVRARPF